ncbi:hypothetical protein SAMN02745196_02319 [Clostridium collagenovorans DSM 3089]|uniref:Uncharacterized protein n=1 Tax=Clostridium collagenovorans DSM 3089 TaxID=1121306 RepID=A0A1M5XMD4_9CLOT|nr:hypothetical protein [Clostridium collagenovorans]SHI01015.1 hypothetical protein SAMN02745196_02319 [Clostridium collagenovorans DSM 3089]
MYGKFKKCDYCGHRERVYEQHCFMLGMDTARLVCGEGCECEYIMFKDNLLDVTDYMFDKLEKEYKFNNCSGCKIRNRSINSKKYFYKMLKVVENQELRTDQKLEEAYGIENEYFDEFGGF